jgi:hypothetical protein
LLEVVTPGDPIVVVARSTGLLRTIRKFTFYRERRTIIPFEVNLWMGFLLRRIRKRRMNSEIQSDKESQRAGLPSLERDHEL